MAIVVELGRVRKEREAEALVRCIRTSAERAEARAQALPPGREKDVAIGWTLDTGRVVEDLLARVRALGGSPAAEEEALALLAQSIGWQACERGFCVEEMQDQIETGAALWDRVHDVE